MENKIYYYHPSFVLISKLICSLFFVASIERVKPKELVHAPVPCGQTVDHEPRVRCQGVIAITVLDNSQFPVRLRSGQALYSE